MSIPQVVRGKTGVPSDIEGRGPLRDGRGGGGTRMGNLFSWLRPRQPAEVDAEPAFDPAVYQVSPSPREIIEEFSTNREERDRLWWEYVGLRVQWLTAIRRIERRDDGSIVIDLDDRGRLVPASIRAQVWSADYPDIEDAAIGTRVWIAGMIEDVVPAGIILTDVQLQVVIPGA